MAGGWSALALLAFVDRYRNVYWFFHSGLHDVLVRVLSGFPGLTLWAINALEAALAVTTGTFVVSLLVGTLAVPAGFLTRMIARARLRAGHPNPLDGPRRGREKHPRRAAAWLAMPVVATQLGVLTAMQRFHQPWEWRIHLDATVLLMMVAGALAQGALLRSVWNALLAPTLEESLSTVEIEPHEIRFDAVAVTRETKAAVGGLAVATLAMVAWLCALPIASLFQNRHVFWAIGAYVLTAAVGAVAFRTASRIAVGLDGIHVGGTSRARFFAYRDMDDVRLHQGDLELVRGDRVLLRLQLHGEDAGRRDAIVGRIRSGIARVADVARDGAANFVRAASTQSVARSTRGGTDYRMPAVSREALWALVEGAGVDATARQAAAEVITLGAAHDDRERLRVAAGKVADPRVRIALEELANHEEEEPDVATRSARTST